MMVCNCFFPPPPPVSFYTHLFCVLFPSHFRPLSSGKVNERRRRFAFEFDAQIKINGSQWCVKHGTNIQKKNPKPSTIHQKVTKKEDAFWPISNEADFQLGKNLAANQKQKQANETTTEFGRRCDRDFECE